MVFALIGRNDCIMESVINFIISKFPEIATLLVVAILVWRISVVYHKAKQRLEAVESGIKSLPCEKHEERIEGHAAMKATLDSINEQVLQISKWILRIDNSADTVGALVQKYSPRRMTPFGISLFKLSGADIVVADNEAFFLEEVQRLNPATPYDVEQASLDVVFSNLGNAMFNSINSSFASEK